LPRLKLAIIQPSYIPWRGYFHQIEKADVFLFYDDVQYDKHGWRNRNRIKTANGTIWLTIPVAARGNVVENTPINEIRCASKHWGRKHWATLQQSYGKAPHFERYAPLLEEFYARQDEDRLAELTIDLTRRLARELGIERTRLVRSSELPGIEGAATERLISIMRALGAEHFISGPSARDYLDEAKLAAAKVTLEYMRYEYPEYEQLHPPYDPFVSILDLLFMQGPGAGAYIWGRVAAEASA
jgi:WbqC-like protein family